MTKKILYRTVIQLEVLSEEPIPEHLSLDEIAGECNDGEFSGIVNTLVCNKPIKGIKAAKLVKAQGSSPEFFNMDDNGNEINY